MTGTSTACNVFGRRRDPGLRAPHPAAHPNFPKKSSFFSGKQIGAAQCRSGTKAENEEAEEKETSEHFEKNSSHFSKECGQKWKQHSKHTDMWHQMHRSFECQYRNIKSVGLRCKFEIWMHIDFPYTEGVGWQRFNGRINNIVAKCDMHLTWCCPGHTMAGGNDVTTRYQTAATSGKQRSERFCFATTPPTTQPNHKKFVFFYLQFFPPQAPYHASRKSWVCVFICVCVCMRERNGGKMRVSWWQREKWMNNNNLQIQIIKQTKNKN